jgi:DNA repair ATPase RecN
MAQEKLLSQSSRNLSKAQRAARKEAEEKVVTNQTVPIASSLLNKEEKECFNKLKKINDSFTEADSESLNFLSQYLYMWTRLKQAHSELSIDDERAISLEKRMFAIDKQINQHMTALCIPLSQRLRLANDMAKVMIEERKLANMEAEKAKPVNPLLALLKDDDDE